MAMKSSKLLYISTSIIVNFLIWKILYFPTALLLFSAIRGRWMKNQIVSNGFRLLYLLIVVAILVVLSLINYGIYRSTSPKWDSKKWILIPVVTSLITFVWGVASNW